ncbi:hypothetical protein [Pseudotabrizicola alkalilacus]|uniref:Uncharacterized protein n=1 Tax=Pseudotabrizicola alkalilacus TaxID=2305252 RepID=A0A411YWG9_9RHOB|nr:hypothetical protein [Pseudotabrizicola alkalilacus]RGP35142.1 hypothetical protein D1012_21500 [Pseudotabrizicola alkalilacus]
MARARKDIAGRHQQDGAAAPVPAGTVPGSSLAPAVALAPNLAPPHPCLVQLVRLIARQAAAEDIAAQRAAVAKGD